VISPRCPFLPPQAAAHLGGQVMQMPQVADSVNICSIHLVYIFAAGPGYTLGAPLLIRDASWLEYISDTMKGQHTCQWLLLGSTELCNKSCFSRFLLDCEKALVHNLVRAAVRGLKTVIACVGDVDIIVYSTERRCKRLEPFKKNLHGWRASKFPIKDVCNIR